MTLNKDIYRVLGIQTLEIAKIKDDMKNLNEAIDILREKISISNGE